MLKSRSSSLLRVFLSLVLIISLMPAFQVRAYADESSPDSAVASSDQENPVVETFKGSRAIQQAALGFVYFDEGEPVVGQTQQIVVAVDEEEGLTLDSAMLTYLDPEGKARSIESQACYEGAALFSFTVDQVGKYQLERVEASVHDSTDEKKSVEINLAAEGENAAFNAVEDPGITLEIMSEDGSDSVGDEADISVYALDPEGELKESESFDGTLSVAEAGLIVPQSSNGKFVVALDPGHGGTDSGACSNGLREADINWAIAQACKTELEKYSDVTVFMTRTKNELPGLTERAERAKKAGADVFVSIHINSAAATSANGAEVYYPNNSSYLKDTTHVVGKDLAQNILKELVGLGLTNRGIKVRNSENNSKYPDGSLRDYYTVIAAARERGIPGIIVEHAFISNASDAAKLADNAFLTKLGVADAQGIVKTFSLKARWSQQANGTWMFVQSDGSYAKSKWLTIAGKKYWFDKNGTMVTGVKKIDGQYYCFESSGALTSKTGWVKDGNVWYWSNTSGIAQGGWVKAAGKWYYMNPTDKKMLTGWQTIDGEKYYLDASGAMRAKTGWFNEGGSWYWIGTYGAAQGGWVKTAGKWYYMNPTDKKMLTGWQTIGGEKYYLDASGAMRAKTGWFNEGGSWYWIGTYGAAQGGWVKTAGKWYYLDPTSKKMLSDWQKLGDTWYFLDKSSGAMKTGWFKEGSTWYLLASSGAMLTGWQKVGGKWYYLDTTSGAMAIGERTIDNQPCFFEKSGEFIGNGTPIMGASKTNVLTMTNAFTRQLASMKKSYPVELAAGGAATPADFCKIIYEEANAEGVRAEVVWAQVMLETGWLQMGGDVKITQYNFAGLGATGGGVAGATFPDVRTGIRAQVQHLKCYASTLPLNNACVDPRWWSALRGKAKLVEWLGIPDNPYGTGWAAGQNYGSNLRKIMNTYLGV